MPEAVKLTFTLDIPCTYFPKVLRYPASSDRFIDTVGFTLAGMLQVIVYELDPTDVSPE